VQGELLVQVNLAKPVVNPGDSQSLIVKAVDAKTFKQISGANVQIRMTDGFRNIEHPGVTDSNGLYNYTWTIDPTSKFGAYKIVSNVSKPGYTSSAHDANFQVQGQLLVQVNLAKPVVNPGDSQQVSVSVLDSQTKQKISGAKVIGNISGSRKFMSSTDNNGMASYSWNISPVSGKNNFSVTLDVSQNGYSSLSRAVAFKAGDPIHLLGPVEDDSIKPQAKTHAVPNKDQCTVSQFDPLSNCKGKVMVPINKAVTELEESPSAQIFG
jgi:hypothetical protein